jgi:hypothetical protein
MEHANATGSERKQLRRRACRSKRNFGRKRSRRFVSQKAGRRQEGSGGGNELVISEPNSLAVMGVRLHHREAADKRTATAGFCSLPRSIAEPFRRS